MKKISFALVFALTSGCYNQKQFSGRIEDRNLTRGDFVGIPNDSLDYDAFTKWYVNYKYDSPIFHGDTAKIEFEVWRELSDQSWVRKKTKADKSELLKHEQGHYDISKLFEIELKNTLKNEVYLKSDCRFKIDSLYNKLLQKYLKLEKEYDIETNHMYDTINQKKWDTFFREQLKNEHTTNPKLH